MPSCFWIKSLASSPPSAARISTMTDMRTSTAGALLSGSGPVRYVVDTNPDLSRDPAGSGERGRQRRDADVAHDGQTITRDARRTSPSLTFRRLGTVLREGGRRVSCARRVLPVRDG